MEIYYDFDEYFFKIMILIEFYLICIEKFIFVLIYFCVIFVYICILCDVN